MRWMIASCLAWAVTAQVGTNAGLRGAPPPAPVLNGPPSPPPNGPGVPNGPGLSASATFIGFNTFVPQVGTVLSLSFVASFGPSDIKTPRQLDGVMVPAVFTLAGMSEVSKSACGTYDSASNVFRGRTVCVRDLVHQDIEKQPKKFVAAPNVTTSTPLVTAALSGVPLHFSASTYFPNEQGFFFSVVSAASSPVILSHIQVTGPDLKSTVDWPDVKLAPAEPVHLAP